MTAFAFVLGALLRLAYFVTDRSLWSGEWSSIEFSMGTPGAIVRTLAHDVHPPLYFLILHYFQRCFGAVDWAYRAPSLAAGLLALPAVYQMTKKMFDRRIARRALLLLAFSPYAIHQSVEVRGHGLLLALCAAGTLCWLKIRQRPSLVYGLGFLAAATAAFYTVHFAWFWFAALVLWHALNSRKGGLWLAGAFAAGMPGLVLLIQQSLAQNEWSGGWADLGLSAAAWLRDIAVVFWHPMAGPFFYMRSAHRVLGYAAHSAFFWLSLFIAVWAWACVLALWNILRDKNPPRAAFFFAVILLPVLTLAVINPTRLDTRYFAFAFPFILVLLSAGLERHRPLLRRLFLIAYMGTSLVNVFWMCRLGTDPYYRENDRAMMAYALEHAGPHDAVNDSLMLRYYMKTRGWKTEASLIPEDLPEGIGGGRFEHIYLVDGQPLDSPAFAPFLRSMRAAGYEPAASERVFGAPESRALLNIFKRSNQT